MPATPGGHLVGLATPAITPAILPSSYSSSAWKESSDGWPGSLVRERDSLAAIPQSPVSVPLNTNSTGVNTPNVNATKSPRIDDASNKDYFSFRSSRPASSSNAASKEPSPNRQGDSGSQAPPTPAPPATPATPGKSGLMGRFKGLGGKGKKTPSTDLASAFPSMPEHDEAEEEPSEDKEVSRKLNALQFPFPKLILVEFSSNRIPTYPLKKLPNSRS